MGQPVSSLHDTPSRPQAGRAAARIIAMAGGLFGAVVLSGTLALWAHYGTTVFFDMITSGIAACL